MTPREQPMPLPENRSGTLRRPGLGLLIGMLLLGAVEVWLHSDHFLYRFRSVFAAGRAMDKVRFVESSPPEVLILGNSRADNGFAPHTCHRGVRRHNTEFIYFAF